MKVFKILFVSSVVIMVLGFSLVVVYEYGNVNVQSLLKSILVLKEVFEYEKFFVLFVVVDQCDIELNLIMVIFCGDMCYVDRMGDFLIDFYVLVGKIVILLNLLEFK